jgi:zinc transport system substrate-binding protein
VERKPFIVFHPTWGYFAAAYGLQQIPVQLAGNEPSAQELQTLIAFARAKGIKVVFVQPEFSTRSARTIAQNIRGQIVVADALAHDWAKNMLAVAREMAGATK